MKQTIITLACVLLSPLAFAQTSPTEDENPATKPATLAQTSPTEDENPATEPAALAQTSPTEDENPVTEPSPVKAEDMKTVSGTVLAFTAEEMLVLKTTADEPMNFMLSKTAYVDGAGHETPSPMINEGTKVQVTYILNGDQMVANRVAFQE
jgi:hypothetical protein